MSLSRRFLTRSLRRLLCTSSNDHKKRIWDRAAVEAAAAKRKQHERAVDNAKWASSWMMPWERAQMDTPTRPLKLWERVYWRLFIVLGGVGFAYETWVLGNRRILVPERAATPVCRDADFTGMYAGNQAFRSQRLLSDDEVESFASGSEGG